MKPLLLYQLCHDSNLGNETPFARAKRMIPQFVFDNLGLVEIDAREVRMRMEDEEFPF